MGILHFFVTWLGFYFLPHGPTETQPNRLLADFQSIPENAMEHFVPQLCSILTDEMFHNEYLLECLTLLEYLLLEKCANSMSFGIRCCNVLKACSSYPYGDAIVEKEYENRIRCLLSAAHFATSRGHSFSTLTNDSMARAAYFKDFNFLLGTLSNIGPELKSLPVKDRPMRLKVAMVECTRLLRREYDNYGQLKDDVSWNSLNYPLSLGSDPVHRMLSFAPEHCRILPSKDNVPFVVLVEVLNMNFTGNDELLYRPSAGYATLKDGNIMNITKLNNLRNIVESSNTASNVVVTDVEVPAKDALSDVKAILSKGSWSDDVVLHGTTLSNSKRQLAINASEVATPSVNSMAKFEHNGNQRHSHTTLNAAAVSANIVQNMRSTVNEGLSITDNPAAWHFIQNNLVKEPLNAQSPPPRPTASLKHFNIGPAWFTRKEKMRQMSKFGHLPNWDAKAFIVKSGGATEEIRQEILAMQLLSTCQQIFLQSGLDIFLRPYHIMATEMHSGIIEFLQDSYSIDFIKKSASELSSLKDFYEYQFGPPHSQEYSQAVRNFATSLAGYSLITYLMQVRDRHNGNILIDSNTGHMIHVDYGFIFGDSPGFNLNYESAPFKLTAEYVDLLGGTQSPAFKLFEDMVVKGMFALKRNMDPLYAIVKLFYGSRRPMSAEDLRDRLEGVHRPADVVHLIHCSLDNDRTNNYDWYQQVTNNIL